MSYWHFTCDHGHQGIGTQGLVMPNWNPIIGATLAWFTNDPAPERDDVGLTSETIYVRCDRMKYRYRAVDSHEHLKLIQWRASVEKGRLGPHTQMDLQRFGKPETWWVARTPVLVTLDQP